MIFKKIKNQDKSRDIYFCGMKCFSYGRKNKLCTQGSNNLISIAPNVSISGNICGNDNSVFIDKQCLRSFCTININGNHNRIFIKGNSYINNLEIKIGNHFSINNSIIEIGEGGWIGGLKCVVESDKSQLYIGGDFVISSDVFIRMGEYPHLIFDKITGKYLDTSTILTIGNHVWLGEKVTILKKAKIPDGCIVGTCSVVTRRFEEDNVLIAGNPAEIRKKNVFWERDLNSLDKDSKYYTSLKMYQNKVD